MVKRYVVPVPPIEIQDEIVRILDSFAELEAELEARKAQYAYYRDTLLNFERGGVLVEWLPMSKVLAMKAGEGIASGLISGEQTDVRPFACYGGNGIRGYVMTANQKDDAVLVGRQGALCGNVRFAKGPFYATEHAIVVKPCVDLDKRFLFHALTVAELAQYKTSGAQPGLSVARLGRAEIPVPPLEVQERIVSILDRFDALTTSLTDGLPAEIEARRKQYEYYRDKLLDFPHKESA